MTAFLPHTQKSLSNFPDCANPGILASTLCFSVSCKQSPSDQLVNEGKLRDIIRRFSLFGTPDELLVTQPREARPSTVQTLLSFAGLLRNHWLAHKLKVLRTCSIRFQLWSAETYFTDSLKPFLTGLVNVRRKNMKNRQISSHLCHKTLGDIDINKNRKIFQTWNMLVVRDRKASKLQKISTRTSKYEGRTSISVLLEKRF